MSQSIGLYVKRGWGLQAYDCGDSHEVQFGVEKNLI
jgi:hypothetical protein